MYYLEGLPAFCDFEFQQVKERLAQVGVTLLAVKHVYWLDLHSDHGSHLAKLCGMLDAEITSESSMSDGCFWVIPRQGAQSPWSSRATDIFQQSHLDGVNHIEKGRCYFYKISDSKKITLQDCVGCYDPLLESCLFSAQEWSEWFAECEQSPMRTISILSDGLAGLKAQSKELGLSLSEQEMHHLLQVYEKKGRDPSAAELMMFAQVNSEHCRHKTFNATWTVNGVMQPVSLFKHIRYTHASNPGDVIVAYSDNAAVFAGFEVDFFSSCPHSSVYLSRPKEMGIVLKVETHNHPTGISPHAGAATGSGGEIRDEAATGRGGAPKMGMSGYMVSNLGLTDALYAHQTTVQTPAHLASSLEIMLEAPMGAALYNNEFGRPALLGFFRTVTTPMSGKGNTFWGYHKPLMIAGGVGHIAQDQAIKKKVQPGDVLCVLGGPGFLIGLGGGALSSKELSEEDSELDYASVQRANPEMQRRAQEFINRCYALGKENPLISIHDVGAGGLSNALPELVEADGLGATIDLSLIPVADTAMSPMEIWCNESQERYVFAANPSSVDLLQSIAKRERAVLAVVGVATKEPNLVLEQADKGCKPIDLAMSDLFEVAGEYACSDSWTPSAPETFDSEQYDFAPSLERVLSDPAVSDKSFLITIGDRSVTGLVVRDQMVGPWQVPVADVAVTASCYTDITGEAMSVGERSPIAMLNAPAAARMALGEALTNLTACRIKSLDRVILSANWMAAAEYPGEGAKLYQSVETVARELCPALGLCIPVGKDSLSMRTTWKDKKSDSSYDVVSPQTLVVTAAAAVPFISDCVTPQLDCTQESVLLFVDCAAGERAMGASIFAQVNNELSGEVPDLRNPNQFAAFFKAIQALHEAGVLLAYHDRSDGGLVTTLTEMMFASHCGLDVAVPADASLNAFLFNEELGACIQVPTTQLDVVQGIFEQHSLSDQVHTIAEINNTDSLTIMQGEKQVFTRSRVELARLWSRTSFVMQSLRDNPETAQSEYDRWLRDEKGLSEKVTFEYSRGPASVEVKQPIVGILREQGVNGYSEMAAAFTRAGFKAVDVHMSDLHEGRVDVNEFDGLAMCGGFSFGDVLGAGRGWAEVILNNPVLRKQFAQFFENPKTFALGVCNGCQMLSQLRSIIPGAEHWPKFVSNESGRFESRFNLVKIQDSPSVLLKGMAGSVLSVISAHGEGHVEHRGSDQPPACLAYVDGDHNATEVYPHNPNGSVGGEAAFTSEDGRVTLMMPHPERVALSQQKTWDSAREFGESGPWMQLFHNAYDWVSGQGI